jgi:outer membrane protein TolC
VSALLLTATVAMAQEIPPSPEPEAATPPESAVPSTPVPEAPTAPAVPVTELQLTLSDVVERALKNNTDIAVERFNPESAKEDVRGAKGVYDPELFSSLSLRSQTEPASNIFAGAEEVETDNATWNFGASQYLPTGGSLRLDFVNSRTETNSIFSTFNPSYNSGLNFNIAQPLLRDFTIDRNRLNIMVARKNQEITDAQFRQTVVNIVANVKNLYYELLFAIDNLDAQRKSLELARKLLEENRIKVRVGTLAPLDVVAAESEVASREETVILAEATLQDAEDSLRRAIFPDNKPETWTTHLVLTDRPTAEPVRVDAERAVREALEKRTDVVAQRKNLETADLQLRLAKNQTLPAVDLVAGYGSNGLGGTFIERDGQGGPVISTIAGGYSDALGSVFGFDFPTWAVGVNFSYPLFNRVARADSARARLAREQGEQSMRRLEMQVTQEVRSAVRSLETNYKRVESTRAARVLQERRLDAEQKKFAAGLSTNFLVTQAQRDLALAEVSELRAVLDYRTSEVNFERVQEAGGGVAFGGVTTFTGVTTRGLSRVQSQANPANPTQ